MATLSWHQCVKLWYPDLLERAYFLPHVYMNRVLHQTEQVAGVDVAVPQTPAKGNVSRGAGSSVLHDSEVREDVAQQHVLYCLRELANHLNEVMFVLSQMNFVDYLGSPSYSAAAKLFPQPRDLKDRALDRGDFDVVVISKEYGLLACEIKATGARQNAPCTAEQRDDEVLKTLRKMWLTKSGKPKMTGQMGKARQVLEHIIGDITPAPPRVRTTLILPYVTSGQLRRVLETDPVVKQALCKELGVSASDDPVPMCLCADQMSPHNRPWDVSANDLQHLKVWWHHRMTSTGPDDNMNDQVYEEVVSRFAGPATVVKVYCPSAPRLQISGMRTEGEYIAETGKRLTAMALFPQQVQILHEALDLVFLAGPPGTGKTLMLVLIALRWLRLRRRVLILALTRVGRAVAYYIRDQLRVTARASIGPDAVKLIDLHFTHIVEKGVEGAACDVLPLAADKELNIIADEASQTNLLLDLSLRLQKDPSINCLRFWAASVYETDAPECMKLFKLTDPLRCPPAIVREVQRASGISSGMVPSYTDNGVPPPAEGPKMMTLHRRKTHVAEKLLDCQECGEELGRVLADLLDSVGKRSCAVRNTPVLRNRDVFILTSGVTSTLTSIKFPKDQSNDLVLLECALVGALKRFVPIRVVAGDEISALNDVAANTGQDHVIMVNENNVRGLERKVVVLLDALASSPGVSSLGGEYGRLHGVSRCTSQLIWMVNHNRGPLCACESFDSVQCQPPKDSTDEELMDRFY